MYAKFRFVDLPDETIVQVDWDIERFALERSESTRGARCYEKATLGRLINPACVHDRAGALIMWYLPDLLCKRRTVGPAAINLPALNKIQAFWNGALKQTDVRELLTAAKVAHEKAAARAATVEGKARLTWRQKGFLSEEDAPAYGTGCLDVSPGWFQQRQSVSFIDA
jgi:hypothetical protein